MAKVSLEQVMGGALQEQFGKAFDRVIENLADPNTSFKEARKITIELKFTQNEGRDDVSCAVSVKEKLATQAPMNTAFMVGKDLKTGKIYAEEYGKHNHLKGQTNIFDNLGVDPDTGEVLEGKQQKAEVIDLRRVMNG